MNKIVIVLNYAYEDGREIAAVVPAIYRHDLKAIEVYEVPDDVPDDALLMAANCGTVVPLLRYSPPR